MERYERHDRHHSECMDGLREEFLARQGAAARARWLARECPRFRGSLVFP